MVWKYVAQIALSTARVVGRAFYRAVQEEYVASQQAAKSRGNTRQAKASAGADTISGMSLQEAKLILNVKDVTDTEAIQKNYDHLFNCNSKSKGGSLYIQSKVYRAKERIDEEVTLAKEQSKEDS